MLGDVAQLVEHLVLYKGVGSSTLLTTDMTEKPEKLSNADKARIKQVMKTDEWESVIRFFALKLTQWQSEKITGISEFDTLKNLHTMQGKVDGLEEFMNQLEQQAYE